MTVPDYPGHAQAIERAVKAVTIASASVCGEERRDGHVRSNCDSREIFGPVESKQDLANLLLNRWKMLLKSNNKEFLVESCLIAKQPRVKRKVMINQSFTRPGAKIYKIVVIFK